jgi:hypothetical protein
VQLYGIGVLIAKSVMYILLNQQKEPSAYIENMMILDATKQSVIGIIIGDCFFGKKDHVIGKIFKDHAYLVSGEIIASVIRNSNYISTAPTKEQVAAAWEILSCINKHTSDWIVEKNSWASISLEESLS